MHEVAPPTSARRTGRQKGWGPTSDLDADSRRAPAGLRGPSPGLAYRRLAERASTSRGAAATVLAKPFSAARRIRAEKAWREFRLTGKVLRQRAVELSVGGLRDWAWLAAGEAGGVFSRILSRADFVLRVFASAGAERKLQRQYLVNPVPERIPGRTRPMPTTNMERSELRFSPMSAMLFPMSTWCGRRDFADMDGYAFHDSVKCCKGCLNRSGGAFLLRRVMFVFGGVEIASHER